MKTFKVKNYKGNLLESTKKFQASHKNMRIVEAFEDAGVLNITAEPNVADPELQQTPPPEFPAAEVAAQETADPIAVFGSKLLSFGVEAHLWHLNCSRNAEHLALKDLYEACDDVGDRLLEASIGQTGVPAAFVGTEDMDPAYTEASIGKIVGIKNEAAALIGAGDAGMDNILGEFCETCNSIIYKLKRLA